MSQLDLTFLTNSLDASTVDRGVTAGATPPNGGGTFVYGFNSLQVSAGSVGLFANQANFAPAAAGGSVRGAVKRGLSGGATGWSAFLFCALQGPSVADTAYMLGLQDDNPSHIVLAKLPINFGLPAGSVDPTNNGILARSTDEVEIDDWVHLRLDVVVNGTGDVVLNVYQSDLSLNTVSAPVWEAIPGMDQFIDDALAVNTGSAPLTSGRMGFGCRTSDVSRRAYFDSLQVFRQI